MRERAWTVGWTRLRRTGVGAALALALVSLLAACSSSARAHGDEPADAQADAAAAEAGQDTGDLVADATSDEAAAPAPPDAPKEITQGGPVMAKPRIVPITYEGDPFRANIESFVTKLGASSFWHSVTAEYGVGAAVSGHPVHLAGPAPAAIDDVDVKKWITSMLDGTHPEFDPLDAETMYAIYYPAGTTYTLGGWTGCKEFGASDNLAQMPDGRLVAYIVLPRCPPAPTLDAWNSLSAASSHEFYEEATDPFKTAWVTVDAPHMAFSLTPPFSEIGDMCIADAVPYVVPPDVGSAVQRAWSNAAAAGGHDPCVPTRDATPYFVAYPVLGDDVPISFAHFGWSGTTKGVHVPVGQTASVDVRLWADAPAPPWRVRAYDFSALLGNTPELELSLDRDMGQAGDSLVLTIKAVRAGADGGSRFLVYSDDGVHDGFWFGYVAN